MQTLLTLTQSQLADLQAAYQPQYVPAPAHALFCAKKAGVTITAYRSGKVLFQGAAHASESARWQSASARTAAPGLPPDFAEWSVLGSDEVGAGSYFGPLTTAAVYLPAEQHSWAKRLGIADSKTLTDKQMATIAQAIIAKLQHHVVNLMPAKYNALQPTHNVNSLKALCHNFALQQVLTKIRPTQPQAILIDQFTPPATYRRHLQRAQQMIVAAPTTYFSTKAEHQHLSVAAASILARYVELQTMAKLSAEAGCELPIGAGATVDRTAATLLDANCDLRHYAKLHFANTAKAERYRTTKKQP